LNYTCMALLAR